MRTADDTQLRPTPVTFHTFSSTVSRVIAHVFSFPAMLGSLLAGAVFVAGRLFNVDPDLWWHIKVGDLILATHRWPTTDIYSFTVPGQPWLAYEWLGDVLLAGASHAAGLRGLDALLIAMGSAVLVALYALASLTSGNSKAGFVAASILFTLAAASFSMRPQMLGYLFLVLTLIALERFRKGKRGMLWLLPFLMLFWVNTHGSWIIGLGTIFVYWVCGLVDFHAGSVAGRRWSLSERQTISSVFLFCVATLPFTPYGTRIAASPFEFAFSLPLNVTYIQEWKPMPFNLPGGKLFLILVLSVILVQILQGRTWRLETLTLFLFGTIMACLHVRFVLIFVPFFAPVLADPLARWIPPYNRGKDKFLLNAVLIACVVMGVVRYFPSGEELERLNAEHFPAAAVEYLEHHSVPEPMYNSYGFGGYLVWSRGPEHKVFIDGRGDVYERGGVLADYIHISGLRPGTLAVLDAYGVRSCLVERDEPLATLLASSSRWQRIYVDDVSSLFIATKPSEMSLPKAP